MDNDSDKLEITRAVEDFLKAVFSLQQQQERVSTNDLAQVLDRTQPTVTDMAQRLMHADLLDYQKYRGVRLTSAGEDIALKIIRRHRLIELFLVRELGYELHEVHDEAERLEHSVSDRFIDAVAHRLDHPRVDPHGDIIPAADGTMAERELQSLADLPEQTPAVVSRLKANSGDMLQYILDRGFHLDVRVEVLSREPFEGPITALVNGTRLVIGNNVAACIDVEKL